MWKRVGYSWGRNMSRRCDTTTSCAKRYGFYLHSDLVVTLVRVCFHHAYHFLVVGVPTASRIISLVPTGRFFARLQYTRVARARVE